MPIMDDVLKTIFTFEKPLKCFNEGVKPREEPKRTQEFLIEMKIGSKSFQTLKGPQTRTVPKRIQ